MTVRAQKVYSSAPDGAVAYTPPSGTATKGHAHLDLAVSNGSLEPPKSDDDKDDAGDKKKDDKKDKKKDRGASRGDD